MDVVIFYILTDLIYPPENPLVMPYSVEQLANKPPNEQAQSKQLNTIIRHYCDKYSTSSCVLVWLPGGLVYGAVNCDAFNKIQNIPALGFIIAMFKLIKF
jgi:hypothetical protein